MPSVKKKLEAYELKIDPTKGSFVDAVALVDEPAIESDFIAFNKAPLSIQFTANDERQELLGAAMIPNLLIYRQDSDGSEYNVFFSADTIREIAQTFMKSGLTNSMNLDHQNTDADSTIFQSYIVDTTMGMSSPKGLNLPNGSWVIGTKVYNQDVWNSIKSGERKGFSVQGIFEFFEKHKQKDEDITDAEFLKQLNILNKIFDKIKIKK